MTALARERTVPAFPLGRPVDGRERFGMTPEQARIYRWLVQNKPLDKEFKPRCREVSRETGISLHAVHHSMRELDARGWLIGIPCKPSAVVTKYRFVQPVMMFKAPRHG